MTATRAADAPAIAYPAQAGRIIAAPVLLTVLAYGWYNVQFVQHQGRYLFTALIPIAIGFSLGWDEAVAPRSARILAAGSVILGGIVGAAALAHGEGLPKWPIVLTGATAIGLALTALFSGRLRSLSFALPFILLPIVAAYAVWGPITP
jgi:hypothetical protein